jgi:flavin reductase (DIM6/NTAB) family NADH-FMN oxidoreductase RutF
MIHIDQKEIQNLDKVSRLNLINSCMGYKSANLIGSISKEGIYNVAIFSSITHLGSDPAMLGFILRPTTVPRHTYSNLKEMGVFTVNAITEEIIKKAHQTSASYKEEINEFEETGIESELKPNISVPFVKNSPVQLLCNYVNEYTIKENNTIHIIASIESIFVQDTLLQDDYWIQLDQGNVVAINGLDGYAQTKLIERYAYARPNQPVKIINQ